MIVDINALRVVGHIADSTPGAGYLVAAETNRGITGQGVVFNLADGTVGQHLHAKATGFAYDPVSKRAFLLGDTVTVLSLSTGGLSDNVMPQRGMGGGGGGGAAVGMEAGMVAAGCPARSFPVVATPHACTAPHSSPHRHRGRDLLRCPAPAVSGVTDAKGRAFLSLVSRDSLAIVDTDRLKVESVVGLSSCKHPMGLAIDNVHSPGSSPPATGKSQYWRSTEDM